MNGIIYMVGKSVRFKNGCGYSQGEIVDRETCYPELSNEQRDEITYEIKGIGGWGYSWLCT